MSKIGKEELKHKVVTQIKKEGLSGMLETETIDKICERVFQTYRMSVESGNDFVGEKAEEDINEDTRTRPPVQTGPNHFPYEQDFIETSHPKEDENNFEETGQLAGSEPTDVAYEPVRADSSTPPVPAPLQSQEPGEIIVFDYNEAAAVSGENLANKPFRLKNDPETKKTIHDFWMNDGVTQIKVYAAKFEEIGQINFDYRNGTAHFSDIKQPTSTNKEYQENPYASKAMPQIETPSTETDLRKTIESSVDLEGTLMKVLKNIIKDGLKEQPEVTEPTIPTPAAIEETMSADMVRNTYGSIDTPEKIKQRLLGEMVQDVDYVRQSKEVATYLFEGKKYLIINGEENKAYVAVDS